MSASASEPAPATSSEGLRLKARYSLGRYSRDEFRRELLAQVNELSDRLAKAKRRLLELRSAPALQVKIRELDAQLNATLAQSKRTKLRAGLQRLLRAEVLLADVEAYVEALDAIERARETLEQHLELWKLQATTYSPTLAALRRVLDVIAPGAASKGNASHARELALTVQRELAELAKQGASGATRERCPICTGEMHIAAAGATAAAAVPRAEYGKLRDVVRCELASQRAWEAAHRAARERKRQLEELRLTTLALAQRIQQETAALKAWPPLEADSLATNPTSTEESR